MRQSIPSTMKALTLTDSGPLLRTDYPVPQPKAGEALIQVQMAGICSTDLQLCAGYKGGYRGVLGHEFVGTVVQAENAEWVGQRVVGELNSGCGACDLCLRGLGKHCRARDSLGIIGRDGAFAEYLTLPVANLHRVPADLPDEQAVFTEPLAAALQLLEQVHIAPTSRVYLLGSGRLGLLIAQVLATTNCDLTVIGRTPAKLKILDDLGIQTRIGDVETLATLAARPADFVVEATGSEAGFRLSRRMVRPSGAILLKSTFAGGLPNFDISSLVVDEISLIGSRCGPFAPALRLLQQGKIATNPLISARYPLSCGVEGLERAGQPGIVKVLIQVSRVE